ncbi:hypothetical protein K438DRAFT_1932550 [Mycena galopus ATCC 62051]|nr:hypothetical protein K438DRAFT_1932550 [Mycena galopus ATCC 62051]
MPRQPTVDEIRLSNITTCLKLTLPLLDELNDAFGPPFVQPISNTIQGLIDLAQNVKRNKRECTQLMNNIHEVLPAIINVHIKSQTVGSLSPSMLDNVGRFMETLHKIYGFVEAQQEGTRIKHLFRNNEMNTLLQECHAGLKQAQVVFGIQTQAQKLNDIRDFQKTADLLHKELIELIEKLSDTTSMTEQSSVYLGQNESKNSSNSFSILPSKPKIFHGRENELTHILKLMGEQSPRIAILGGGGMGKTSLARAVLHHSNILSKYEHRFFVSAEAATTSIELAALIGLHVGLNPGHDLRKPVVQYLSRKEPCLVILDNLETVWEPIHSQASVEEFLSLLTELDNLALMITMRGAERPGKVQWTHPFLLPLQPLSNDAARQTFMDITGNSNTIEEMDQLLQFTDNMPLAIDLIAHLADYEGFSNVLARWKTEKTSLFTIGFDRKSSLDASINLSLSSPRITPGSKELLSLLSILPNGLSGAELLQCDLGIPNILSCQAALQATSLAYRDSNQRVVVLMPIREYIQRILPPSQASIQSICQHFYALVALSEKYHGAQLQAVVNQITLNLANLVEILQGGLHSQAPTLADTIQCILSLGKFCDARGWDYFPLMDNIWPLLSHLCDHRLETMVVAELLISREYWPSVSEQMIAQAISYLDHANDPVLGSRFYQAAGVHFFYHKPDVQRATQFFHKALGLSELGGDLNQQCRILIRWGWIKWGIGDYGAAHACATAAQRLSQMSAYFLQGAYAYHLGASCSRSLGDCEQSAAQLYRATDLLHICGMSGGVLDHEIALGKAEIHLWKSEYTEARKIFFQVIKTSSTEENSFAHANALLNVALIDIRIGEPEKEISHNLNAARKILRRGAVHPFILCHIDMLQTILELREGEGSFDIAKVKLQECLYLSWSQNPEGACLCLEQLAHMKAWPADEWQEKWPFIYLAYTHRSKGKLDLHKAILSLGDVFLAKEDNITATNLYEVALAGFTQMDVHHSRAQCMLCLGDLANKHGHISEAINFWKTARSLFERSSQGKAIAEIDAKLVTCEDARLEAFVKLETLHAPVQLNEGTFETEGKDSVDEHEHRAAEPTLQ